MSLPAPVKVLFIGLFLFFVAMQRSFAQCAVPTVNPGFELPVVAPGSNQDINQTMVPGWRTTESDGEIEFWGTGFIGVPAYSGNAFVELNANAVGGLYQDYYTPYTTVFTFSFAHRGRLGLDTAGVYAGPPGGPYTLVDTAIDGTAGWRLHTGTYTVPVGQDSTRFIFEAIGSFGGDPSIGNFLDAVNFTAPTGTIVMTAPAAVCAPATVNLTAPAVTAGSSVGLTYTYYTNSLATTPLTTPSAVTTTGTYYVVGTTIEGCSDTASVTATINPVPSITSTSSNTVCNNTAQNYTITSSVAGTSYSWNRATVANITNPGVTGQTANPITETLANTGTGTANVIYVITPVANGCTGSPLNYTVTVDPTATISSGPSGVICTNTAQHYSYSSPTAGATISWSRTTVANISNPGVTGQTANPETENLVNTSTSPVNAVYVVTPVYNGCTGTPFNYTLTVDPDATLALTSGSTAQTVCINTAIGTITYSVGGGGTGATVTGLPTGVTGTYAAGVVTISGTPTTTVGNPFTYTVTTTGTCAQKTLTGSITVNPILMPTVSCGTTTTTSVQFNWTAVAGATGYTISYTKNAGGPINIGSVAATTYTISPLAPGDIIAITVMPTGGGCFAAGTGSCTASNCPAISTTVPAPISVCNGGPVPAVTFVSSPAGATFTCTNNNTSIGLAATETGPTIASFAATNATSSPVTATITVTPSMAPCTGTANTYIITVNPDATLSLTSGSTAQTVCINTAIGTIKYAVGGGGTGAMVTGLPMGVTGIYAGGMVTISGTPSTTVGSPFTYTVTTTGTCAQQTLTGTITVDPDATLALTSAAGTTTQTVCINTAITAITYSVSGGGTGVTITGLPMGVTGSYAGGVVTIGGTPSVTAGSPYSYTVTTTGTCVQKTLTGTITVNPDATLALTSAAATTTQSLCVNTAITNITYSVGGGGTGATVTGLPTGVTGTYAGGMVTISGTPSVTTGSPYNYTVTTTGTCIQHTLTGTITVRPILTPTVSCGGSTTTTTSFNWTSVTGAISYTLSYTINGGPATSGGTTAGTTYTVSSLAPSDAVVLTVTPIGTGCFAAAAGSCAASNCPAITTTVPAPISVCNGGAVPAVTFVSTPAGATFTCTNSMPSIGLAASETGPTIATFAATNATSSPITATVTVTPSMSPCTGTPNTYIITVNPDAALTLTSAAGTDAQTICVNTPITNITYSVGGGATGAMITGLPTGVTGSYAAGVVTISGTPSVTAGSPYTYTVTTTGTCMQKTLTGTITVKPNATLALTSVAGTDAQTPCINTALTDIVYTIGGGATSAALTGTLPAGVTGTFSATTFTISGVPTATGSFTYTITTTGTCVQQTLNGTITVKPDATLALTSTAGTEAQAVCVNSPISNITYSVGGGGTGATLTGLPTGVTGIFAAGAVTISGTPSVTAGSPYTYTITTTGTCVQQQLTGTVTVNVTPTIAVTSSNPTICNGTDGSFTISGLTAGATYKVNYDLNGTAQPLQTFAAVAPGTMTISNLSKGNYTNIIVTTASGCPSTNSGTATLVDPPTPVPTASNNGPICAGTTLDLTVTPTGGATYTWSGPGGYSSNAQDPTIPAAVVANSGTYSVAVTLSGCTGNSSTIATVNPTPVLVTTNPAAICQPGTVDLTAASITAGSTFPNPTTLGYYSDPTAITPVSDPAAVPYPGGNFYITATSGTCADTSSAVVVTVNPKPTPPTSGGDQDSCITVPIQTLVPLAFTADTLVWYNNVNRVVTNPQLHIPGTVTFFAEADDKGCKSNRTSVTLTLVTPPTVWVDDSMLSIDEGYSAILQGHVIPALGDLAPFVWSPNYNIDNVNVLDPTVNPLYDTTYIITATSSELSSCTASASVYVKVYHPIEIPNIFSPNGDGIHDTWYIKNLDEYPNAEVDVFNRYGQFLFQSQGNYLEAPWDGRYNGQLVPVAAYYYIIKLNTGLPGDAKPLAGCISVIY
jgi:gliding motility-associated-like protein